MLGLRHERATSLLPEIAAGNPEPPCLGTNALEVTTSKSSPLNIPCVIRDPVWNKRSRMEIMENGWRVLPSLDLGTGARYLRIPLCVAAALPGAAGQICLNISDKSQYQ